MRRIVLPLIALVLAAAAAWLANGWIEQQRHVVATPAAQKMTPELSVLVAASDLQTGQFLQASSLRWQRWPDVTMPESYLVEGKSTLEELVGAVVRQDLAVGQPVLRRTVIKPGDRGFLAAVLDPGKRAISVAIDETTGNAGLIFPGDRVDLILTQSIEAGGEGASTSHRVSETVLQDLRVLAVGRKLSSESAAESGNGAQSRTATLEVSPAGAERVALVGTAGGLSLSLRSLADGGATSAAEGPGITWDSEVARALVPQNQPFSSVAVIRGGETQSVAVPKGGTK